MVSVIDLNADLGEGCPNDAELLQTVSSCSIACGGHAGSDQSMRATVLAAMANDVAVGAHPSYPDREGFGRRSRFLAGDELRHSLLAQIGQLSSIVSDLGARLAHVKPHGALYNDAVDDRDLADTIVAALHRGAPGAALVGMPNSEMHNAACAASIDFVKEGFIDRAYGDDGRLLPRSEAGAVHDSLSVIVPQALSLVDRSDTLCIHGDTTGAGEIARAVRKALQEAGVSIRAVRR